MFELLPVPNLTVCHQFTLVSPFKLAKAALSWEKRRWLDAYYFTAAHC